MDGTPSDGDDRTTRWTHDGNGNVLSMTADLPSGQSDQTTSYDYEARTGRGDAINSNSLLISTTYPDVGGSVERTESYMSNRAGQRISWTDRNGTEHEYSLDVLGRVTSDLVTALGSGVDGAVQEITASYDDAGRVYELTSLDGGSSVVNQIRRTYNGLGQLAKEFQEHDGAVDSSTLYVGYSWGTSAQGSRLTGIVYPKRDGGPLGGDRTLTYFYDSGLDATISRLSSIGQEGDLMTFPPEPPTYFEVYDYLGLATVVARRHPEADVDLVYYSETGTTGDAGDQYTGLDRFGRIVDQRWLLDAGGHADRFTYGQDRNGNRLWRKNELSAIHSELYMADGVDEQQAYDKLDRLVEFQRGTLSDAVSTPPTGR